MVVPVLNKQGLLLDGNPMQLSNTTLYGCTKECVRNDALRPFSIAFSSIEVSICATWH